MKVLSVIDAEIEAKRFLLAIKKVRMAFPKEMIDGQFSFWCSKHTARLKRASMDLTRSLSAMRRP